MEKNKKIKFDSLSRPVFFAGVPQPEGVRLGEEQPAEAPSAIKKETREKPRVKHKIRAVVASVKAAVQRLFPKTSAQPNLPPKEQTISAQLSKPEVTQVGTRRGALRKALTHSAEEAVPGGLVLPESEQAEQSRIFTELESRVALDAVLKANFERAFERINEGRSPSQSVKFSDLAKVDPKELQLLAGTETRYLTETVIFKIFKREFGVLTDVVRGRQVKVRVYLDDTSNLGAGSLGKVHDGYYVIWETNGEPTPGGKLSKGAVKVENANPENNAKETLKNPAFVLARQNEIDTLRAIRKLPDQQGLLRPIYIGEMGGKSVIITEKIERLPQTKGTEFRHAVQVTKPKECFQMFDEVLAGLDKLHNQIGRIHLDIKAQNIFAGDIKGRPGAVLGDLSTFPLDEVRSLDMGLLPSPEEEGGFYLALFKKNEDVGNLRGLSSREIIQLIVQGKIINVPATPAYFERARLHIYNLIEWTKAHPNEEIPPQIRALPDLGETAEFLHRYKKGLESTSGQLPGKKRTSVLARLERLIARLDDVPNLSVIDENLAAAVKRGDKAGIDAANKERDDAFAKLLQRISIAEVRKELQAIGKLTEVGRTSPEEPQISASPQ